MAASEVQYTIDIATSMPAGESTLAQLDEITARLTGAGRGADHFQQAIVQGVERAQRREGDHHRREHRACRSELAIQRAREVSAQAAKAQEKAALKGRAAGDRTPSRRRTSRSRCVRGRAHAARGQPRSTRRPKRAPCADVGERQKDLGPRRQGTRGSSRDLGQTTRRTRRRGRGRSVRSAIACWAR